MIHDLVNVYVGYIIYYNSIRVVTICCTVRTTQRAPNLFRWKLDASLTHTRIHTSWLYCVIILLHNPYTFDGIVFTVPFQRPQRPYSSGIIGFSHLLLVLPLPNENIPWMSLPGYKVVLEAR